jgi:hypothetical protein
VISRAPTGLAHQSPAASGQPKVVMAMIGLGAVARIVRHRRTYERLIIFAIVVAAAAGMARENQARSKERLVAWLERTMSG